MKLVLGSDLHGLLPPVPPCDALLLAGDLLPENEQEIFIINQLAPWLNNAPAREIFATWGNHDDLPFKQYDLPFRLWEDNLRWQLLVDRTVSWKGLKIHGTPWCRPVGRWAWQAPEYVLKTIYDMIPDDVDILISHTSPRSICDLESRCGENCGSGALLKRMDQLKNLKMLVCGHIHEARGNKGVVFNVSSVKRRLKTDPDYILYHDPWTVVEL